MIDEKKIEEAAVNASIEDTAKGRVREDYVISALADHELGFQEGFKSGINWFLDNIWHDASEEPKQINKDDEFVECLIQFKDGEIYVINYDTWHHWWVCNIDNEEFLNMASRWLYIKDLMKGGK